MKSLERTFAPKKPHYHSDGFGRDSYIVSNNGGLSIQKLVRPVDGGLFLQGAHREITNSPKKESNILKYHCDGTGRDGYISVNSGGLHAETVHVPRPF